MKKTPIPDGLLDVAYISGAECAAAGSMSISQWHALVKEGKAPNPVIRKSRFTRWLLADVREWLIQYSKQFDIETDSKLIIGKAKRASDFARNKLAKQGE